MDVRNRQRGFTLVELMVVVAMVGILSAIGLPRILTYVRTSASAEVSQNAALIASAISTYAQSQRKTAAAISAEINNRDVTPDLSGDNELSATLPLIRLPPDSHFDYSIVAMVVTGGGERPRSRLLYYRNGKAECGRRRGGSIRAPPPMRRVGRGISIARRS